MEREGEKGTEKGVSYVIDMDPCPGMNGITITASMD